MLTALRLGAGLVVQKEHQAHDDVTCSGSGAPGVWTRGSLLVLFVELKGQGPRGPRVGAAEPRSAGRRRV